MSTAPDSDVFMSRVDALLKDETLPISPLAAGILVALDMGVHALAVEGESHQGAGLAHWGSSGRGSLRAAETNRSPRARPPEAP